MKDIASILLLILALTTVMCVPNGVGMGMGMYWIIMAYILRNFTH